MPERFTWGPLPDPLLIEIPGKPRVWSRPTSAPSSTRIHGRRRNAIGHRRGLEEIQAHAQDAYAGEPWEGPVQLSVYFFYEPPASWKEADRKFAIENQMPMISAPDTSNLMKILEDGMQGVVYRNDSQIYRYETVQKAYGSKYCTLIEVRFFDRE